MGPKFWGFVSFFGGGPHLAQCGLGRARPPYQVASDASSHLATIDMDRKLGAVLSPHLTQCGRGRGLPACEVSSSSMQPFGHNRHGPKIGRGDCAPFFERGTGSPSNVMSLGQRPTSVPCGILIHPAIWPQQIWAENWGLCPFGGGIWVPI